MADQRKITLRATHATPKNIILRELPVATPSAGTTIYLYENHATPKNIILRNPRVLDAPAVAPEDFLLGNDDPDLGFMEIDSGEEGEALSFTYGPLPDDVIAAVDLLVNVFDDAEAPDEFDYSFTFSLLEDAQIYAAQFEDAPEQDETDYSFTFTLLEDAQVYGLQTEDEPYTDEVDYDFSLSLQDDDIVVADEPPYQHFDDYDENFEGDEYSFYLGNLADDPVIPPIVGQGDGDITRRKGVKPIVTVRPKAERDLDDVLDLVSEVTPDRRVSENKRTIKAAVAVIKAIEAPPNYEKPIAAIKKALVKVSRRTAKHEGMAKAMAKISADLEALIAEMERKRKRRRREEEEIILWLALN